MTDNIEVKPDQNNDERVFQEYFEDLELTPEDFRKRILDIGAGSAQFAKYAKDHGISDQIYSVDPIQDMLEKEKSVKAIAEQLPFADQSFDMVVSDSAIPNIYIDPEAFDEVRKKVLDSFTEMARVLRPGGEIRLARVLIGQQFESQRLLSETINTVLENLEKEGFEISRSKMPQHNTYQYDEGYQCHIPSFYFNVPNLRQPSTLD